MQQVKIGFVGAGGNARGHMKRLAEIEDARIVAVADVVEHKAKEAAAAHQAAAYTDHHAMLDSEQLDALYVSVPPFAHTDAEILAAQAGLHLFVEKPVVLDLNKGFEILDAIRQAGVLSCVGYQLRLSDATQRIKAYLKDRTVAMISAHRWADLPPTPWWRQMELSGGQLVEQTTHQLDVMRYVTGDEVVAVYAKYATRTMGDLENFTIPDSQAVVLEFSSGILATMSTSPMMNQGGVKSDVVFLLKDQIIGWSSSSLAVIPAGVPELEAELKETPSIDQGPGSWMAFGEW